MIYIYCLQFISILEGQIVKIGEGGGSNCILVTQITIYFFAYQNDIFFYFSKHAQRHISIYNIKLHSGISYINYIIL